jgi:hypothetical protein
MLNDIAWIYRRIPPFILALPFLAAVPFATELLQHLVEIALGLYRSGVLTPAARNVRLAFSVVKIASIIVIVIAALRFWHFDGDTRRALRPSMMMAAGFVVFVALEIVDSSLEDGIASLIARAFDMHAAPLGIRLAVHLAPTCLWTFVSGFWLPWNIALLVDDRRMTLRRSIAAANGQLWMYFGLILGGVIPLMAVHYGLGYAAVGKAQWIVWALGTVDAAIVVLLTVAIASSFYAVYDAAKARADVVKPAYAL